MTSAFLTAGISGGVRHGCVALLERGNIVGVCEQQRVTRSRWRGSDAFGLPHEALDILLERRGRTRADIAQYAIAEPDAGMSSGSFERVDHHLAHACAAYLSSPFEHAAIVVCDHEAPKVSVWEGRGDAVTPVEWSWQGPGFSDLYSSCAAVLGFRTGSGEQQLEALARLSPDSREEQLAGLMAGNGNGLFVERNWESAVSEWLNGTSAGSGDGRRARIAAALQARIGELLLEFVAQVRLRTDCDRLCLGGSLFYHSSMNTMVRTSGIFADVFVPVDPGNPGLAVGAALHVSRSAPRPISAFLGPAYDADEVKATLDNCKLQYDWCDDDALCTTVVDALVKGLLVAWFEGPMEWGARALGGRSILANPFAPYVLENLNRFLKRREPWRGYALSVLADEVDEHFDGPVRSPFMECDYRPHDAKTFAPVLPTPGAALRVQTVDRQAPPRFREVVRAFGSTTGIPCVVNTSFNGFHEPIVCSPRDAVRVFFGSGLDLLVLDRFVLSK